MNKIKITNINDKTIKHLSTNKLKLQKTIAIVLFSAAIAVPGIILNYNYNKMNDLMPTMFYEPADEIVLDMYQEDLGYATINGTKVNLNEMRSNLGAMYYYFEPLTNNQIDDQFVGISKYISRINKVNATITNDDDQYDINGYLMSDYGLMAGNFEAVIAENKNNLMMFGQTYNHMNMMSKIYDLEEFPNRCFEYINGKLPFDNLSTTEKEKFVRDWKYYFDMIKSARMMSNLDPKPAIALEEKSYTK